MSFRWLGSIFGVGGSYLVVTILASGQGDIYTPLLVVEDFLVIEGLLLDEHENLLKEFVDILAVLVVPLLLQAVSCNLG